MQYLNPGSRPSKFNTFYDHDHSENHAGQSHDGETPLSALARSRYAPFPAMKLHALAVVRFAEALCPGDDRLRLPLGARLLWTLSFAIKVAVSYLLMLVVMTFNTGLFAAVIVGEVRVATVRPGFVSTGANA